jgi:hypothetical protein
MAQRRLIAAGPTSHDQRRGFQRNRLPALPGYVKIEVEHAVLVLSKRLWKLAKL